MTGGSMEKGYEKLDIYKQSRELAIAIYRMSLSLPKFEIYEEGSQVRRSAKSIPRILSKGIAYGDTRMNISNIFTVPLALVRKHCSISGFCLKRNH